MFRLGILSIVRLKVSKLVPYYATPHRKVVLTDRALGTVTGNHPADTAKVLVQFHHIVDGWSSPVEIEKRDLEVIAE